MFGSPTEPLLTMWDYVGLCTTMSHYVPTMYHYVPLCTYHYVPLCTTMYLPEHVRTCLGAQRNHFWLCRTMYHYVPLCTTMHHYVPLCTYHMRNIVQHSLSILHQNMLEHVWEANGTIPDYVWLCATMCHYVPLCTTMYHYVPLCTTMYLPYAKHSPT